MDMLRMRGGAIKALADGRVQGYLVLFGDAQQADLTGEYFTAQTDFALQPDHPTLIYYQHGADPKLGKKPIGTGTLRQDAVGVWLEGQLHLRDEYERAIADLLREGKLGLSSGTATHLVERRGGRITRWPLGLDASLTPTPAEPRTQAHAMKSMLQEDDDMTTIQPELENRFNALQGDMNGIKSALHNLLNAPAVGEGGVITPSTNEPPTHAAIKTYLRKGLRGFDSPAQKAALNEGTVSQGGYLVPTGFSPEVVQARRQASILRAAGARVVKVAGNNSYKVPTMTDSSAAVQTGEGAAFVEVEPTFAQISFTPYKYSKLAKMSDELLNDSRFPVESLLLEDAAQAFAVAENEDFTNGTGTGKPQGILAGSSIGVTGAGATISADNVFDLYHSLGYMYRQNAVWLMNDTVLRDIRKLKDSTGQYLWQPGLVAGQPHLLLGRPVFINNAMPNAGVGNKAVIFGDLSYYWIVDWAEMEVKRLDELYAANGQVGYRWYARFDARVMLSTAIKHLVGA